MTNELERQNANGINRRQFLAATAGIAASTSTLTSAFAQASAPSPRVLRFSDHEPLGGMRTRFLKEVLFPAIEREANGRLKIEDHWNGEIAKAYDALGAVSRAAGTDMATVVPEYTAKELPLHQIFKGFPVGPAGSKQVDFFRRIYSDVPALPAELDKSNIVQLFFGTGYPVAFFSTEPMAKLDGMRNGKWRSASFWHLDFLRNSGATPVTMHWGPEIYEALKQKTLDGLMVNVDSGYMLKVHDAAPNVLVSKDLWLGHVYILAMNKDVWAKLSQEDRDAILRAGQAAYQSLGSVMDQHFDQQIDDLRKAGATVRVLDAEEVSHWGESIRYQDIQSKWIDDQTAQGVDAGPVLAAIATIMDAVMD